jgi:DNA-binding NarL/FixJ family response regulator
VRRHVAEGVGGVLPRDADGDIVLAAARLVLAGGRYLPPEVFTPTSADLKNGNSSRDDDAFGLTPRQRNVLGLVAQGLSNKQVAYELSITEGTVKLHVNAILKTLGVSNRTSAALLARERPEIAQGPADDR